MKTLDEQKRIAAGMDNETLLDYLEQYSEYADALICSNEEKHDTYTILRNEILKRMK